MKNFLFILLVAGILGFASSKCTCDGGVEISIPNLPKIANDFLTKLFKDITASLLFKIENLADEFKNATATDKDSLKGFVTTLEFIIKALTEGSIKSLNDLSAFFTRILSYIYSLFDFSGKLSVDGKLNVDLKAGLKTLEAVFKPFVDAVTKAGELLKISTCTCARKKSDGLFGGLFGK